jgi:hypothetical protein
MLAHQLKVKSVNVHRSNDRIHALLNSDNEIDILLIQEPWFNTVATLRSDNNPEGRTQLGAPINNKWDLHTPKHNTDKKCKAIAYTKKKIAPRVRNLIQHPLSGPCIVVLDVLEEETVSLHIVNIYHDVPTRGHGLARLFSHESDELTPTLFIGDFNTHSPLWSLPNSTTLSWARDFEEWMGHNGLELLNPPDTPTWFGSRPNNRPSVLDLALGNKAVGLAGQLSPVIVSQAESLATDHAALLFQIHAITNIELTPPPAPSGYWADDENKASWMKEFARIMPYADPTGTTLPEHLDTFSSAIDTACKTTLHPHQPPRPQGTPWWDETCTTAQTRARLACDGNE